MPRTAMSPAARAANVRSAFDALRPLVEHAENVSAVKGHDHPDAIRAWECVEVHGATIHRQSRLLAGKSRGG